MKMIQFKDTRNDECTVDAALILAQLSPKAAETVEAIKSERSRRDELRRQSDQYIADYGRTGKGDSKARAGIIAVDEAGIVRRCSVLLDDLGGHLIAAVRKACDVETKRQAAARKLVTAARIEDDQVHKLAYGSRKKDNTETLGLKHAKAEAAEALRRGCKLPILLELIDPAAWNPQAAWPNPRNDYAFNQAWLASELTQLTNEAAPVQQSGTRVTMN